MSEFLESQEVKQHAQELFGAVCQEFGSANIVGLLVECFGKDLTGEVLDNLVISGIMSGNQLVDLYARNRKLSFKGELS